MIFFTYFYIKIFNFLNRSIEILSVFFESVKIYSLLVKEGQNKNLIWLHRSYIFDNINKLHENVANYGCTSQNELVIVFQLKNIVILVEKIFFCQLITSKFTNQVVPHFNYIISKVYMPVWNFVYSWLKSSDQALIFQNHFYFNFFSF